MINPVTGKTYACFEPALDYIVTKIPRWPFDKFESANRSLGTQMKATGEVMAIGRTFEESLLKAIRSLEADVYHFELKDAEKLMMNVLKNEFEKLEMNGYFTSLKRLTRGVTIETIHDWSKIDLFFLKKMEKIIEFETSFKAIHLIKNITEEAKQKGFSDKKLQSFGIRTETEVYQLRKEKELSRFIKWLIHVRQNLNQKHHTSMVHMKRKMNQL